MKLTRSHNNKLYIRTPINQFHPGQTTLAIHPNGKEVPIMLKKILQSDKKFALWSIIILKGMNYEKIY